MSDSGGDVGTSCLRHNFFSEFEACPECLKETYEQNVRLRSNLAEAQKKIGELELKLEVQAVDARAITRYSNNYEAHLKDRAEKAEAALIEWRMLFRRDTDDGEELPSIEDARKILRDLETQVALGGRNLPTMIELKNKALERVKELEAENAVLREGGVDIEIYRVFVDSQWLPKLLFSEPPELIQKIPSGQKRSARIILCEKGE